MNYAFPPRAVISAPVAASANIFPINRIYCVGRNYAAHAREMGQDPDRDPPFFFAKDADAYVGSGTVVPYPAQTGNYQYEVELVVAIGKAGFAVTADQAAGMIFGYAVGLDMTRRDLQARAKELGRPWCTAKNFPSSAPMGLIHPISQTSEISNGEIKLLVNGETRQISDVREMIWRVDETIAQLSQFYRLVPGDLIFTGTPEGVGAVKSGDQLVGSIEGLTDLKITIGPADAA